MTPFVIGTTLLINILLTWVLHRHIARVGARHSVPARLYTQLREFTHQMNYLLPLDQLADLVGENQVRMFRLRSVALVYFGATETLVRLISFDGLVITRLRKEEAAAAQLITGDPDGAGPPRIAVEKAPQECLAHCPSFQKAGITTFIPILCEGDNIGLMGLGQRLDGKVLPPEELEVIHAMARQAEIAMRNTRIYSELLKLQDYQKAVVESMENGVVVISAEGMVTSFNSTAGRILGVVPDKVRDHDFREISSLNPILPWYSAALDQHRLVHHQEITLSGVNGEAVTLSLTTSFLATPDKPEKPWGVVLVLDDISRIKALEQQIHRSERLAALGQMVAGLAHEIRNGLNKVNGYALILDDQTPADDSRKKYTAGIQEDVRSLSRMLNEFLLFAGGSRGLNKKQFDLCSVLNGIVECLAPEIRSRGIKLTLNCRPKECFCCGDEEKLRRALYNLVFNAIEAIPPASEGTTPGKINLAIRPRKDHLEVVITDTGCGIPHEIQEQIYNPFFTTKPNGTGLGLSTSHQVILEHHGSMEIHSQPGRGTRLTLQLPLGT